MEKIPNTFLELISGPRPETEPIHKIEWAGVLLNWGERFLFERNYDDARSSFNKAESILGSIGEQNLSEIELVNHYHYFWGGLWSGRAKLEQIDRGTRFLLGSKNFSEAVLSYRKALSEDYRDHLGNRRHAQIRVNLANTLDSSGRFIEAIEIWKNAISIDPTNGMTWANAGQGLFHFGQVTEDRGHRALIWKKADEFLIQGLAKEKEGVYPHAREHFEKIRSVISKRPFDLSRIKFDTYSMGKSAQERKYRSWALHNKLFLNPLNDAYPEAISARDVLSMPSMTVQLSEDDVTPWRQGLFDQLKQEFVSARFLYYEGIQSDKVHFSDKQVRMINSLDYPSYGLATEKTKSSFRALFSILDKISYFLNFYLELGIQENEIKFATMWYEKKKKGSPQVLSKKLLEQENWPLMGLYWLHRDLGLNKDEQKTLEPDMQDMKQIRNSLEHKFLRLHTEMASNSLVQANPISMGLSKFAFQRKGLKLLKLVRASIFYFHAIIFTEEQRRRKLAHQSGNFVPLIKTEIWKDSWKR